MVITTPLGERGAAATRGHTGTPQLEEEKALARHVFAHSLQLSAWDNIFFHDKLPAMVVPCQTHKRSNFPTSNDASEHHADQKVRTEYLWRELYSDPSQWWDNRFTKKNSRQPDFQHKITLETLWIDSWLNPSWVKKMFANVGVDQIQSNGRSTRRAPASLGYYDKVQKLADEGKLKDALNLLEMMAQQTSENPREAFVCLLRKCTRRKALAEGRQVHALIVKTKHDTDVFLSNLLIGMYSEIGNVAEALKVFTAMPQRNVFSWTAMMSVYVKSSQYKEAVSLSQQMHETGIEPDEVACIVALKACASVAALEHGQQLHSVIVKRRFDSNIIVRNSLVDMYAKCGCLKDARELFDNMRERDLVSWNVMITGYAQKGFGQEALDLYGQMKHECMEPDDITLVLLLKACAGISALQQGRQLHSLILKKGLEAEMALQKALVDMYAKCGCLQDARELFDNMTERDVICWNVMIAGYAQQGFGEEALDLYKQMRHEGMEPDNITLVLLLKACASISALRQGRQLHSLILKKGLQSERAIQNTLVDMYAKCGCLNDAREMFDNMTQRDVITWNVMIAGYAQKGFGEEALDLYEQMKHADMEPDNITLVLLLKACASISALEQGRQLHSLILEKGLEFKMSIQNTLIDMYSKCGCLMDARELFNNMHKRDEFSWNVMIAGYSQKGFGKEALDLYEQMKHEGMEPGNITLVLLLKACASISALQQGRELHSLILKKGLESEITIQTSLLDMYAKCGCLKEARELFDNMTKQDVVSWGAMIAGYAQKGLGEEALALYEQMKHEGMNPDKIILCHLLKVCASISALQRGKQLHSLVLEIGLESEMTIQTSLVDMYAKCGCLKDARELFDNMAKRDIISWSAMITGYAQRGLGKEALDLFKQMKGEGLQADDVTYISVLSACSHSGLVDEGRHVFESMSKDQGVTPSLQHYGCVVDLLGRAGYLSDAEDFILKMPIQPNEILWMTLLGAARKHVDVEIGRRAFERIVELELESAGPYLLLMDIYSAAGLMDEAAQLRKEMNDKGFKKGLGNSRIEVNNHAFAVSD